MTAWLFRITQKNAKYGFGVLEESSKHIVLSLPFWETLTILGCMGTKDSLILQFLRLST